MRILLITHFFPPEYNAGTENYTLGLAKAFTNQGHEVQVLCAMGWQTGDSYWNGIKEERHQGFPVHRIHLNWLKADDPNRVLYDSAPVERWSEAFFKSMKPDIVHVTSTHSLGIGLLRAVHREGIPLVLTLMDFWFMCPRTILLRGDDTLCNGLTTPWECQQCLFWSSRLYRRSERFLPERLHSALWKDIGHIPLLARLRGVRGMALDMTDRKAEMERVLELPDTVLAHSRFVQDMFAQVGLSYRIQHLPNGHDLRWTSQLKEKSGSAKLRFGYMGQIIQSKGVHVLIEAFQKLAGDEHAKLDIWGDLEKDLPYSRFLQSLVGDSDSITLRGRFKRDQLSQVLSEMDVLVVPSLWYENAPLVIYEAYAAQTPVIATNLGGMAEAVTHEVDGLLFEQGNAVDLAVQLKRVLDEPDLLENLTSRIPQVKTFDEEVGDLVSIYRKLMTNANSPT